MNASLAIIPYKNNTAINIHYIDKKALSLWLLQSKTTINGNWTKN